MNLRSPRLRIGLAAAVALAGVAAASLSQAADDPANVIKYRQKVMGALGAHIGMIAAVVKGEVSYSGQVAENAQMLATTATMVKDVFPEGSDQGDTRAKPEIWQDWTKFEGLVGNLQSESAKLAEVAKGGDMAAVGAQLQKVGETCGGCHKPFRTEK